MGGKKARPWVHLGGTRARKLSDVLPRGEYEGKTHLTLSRRLIDAGRDDRGRVSDRQAAALGVRVPLSPGWIDALSGLPVRVEMYAAFLNGGDPPGPEPAAKAGPAPARPKPPASAATAAEVASLVEQLGRMPLTDGQKKAVRHFAAAGSVKELRGMVKNVTHTLARPRTPPAPRPTRKRRLL